MNTSQIEALILKWEDSIKLHEKVIFGYGDKDKFTAVDWTNYLRHKEAISTFQYCITNLKETLND